VYVGNLGDVTECHLGKNMRTEKNYDNGRIENRGLKGKIYTERKKEQPNSK
jgi:hypothetical protein